MEEPLPERGAILKAAIGIGLYAMALVPLSERSRWGSGLTLAQTMVLSLVMFTGASQFAFVGVATAGGSPRSRAGKPAAWRTQRVLWRTSFRDPAPRGLAGWTAHFVIDETTAMAVAKPPSRPALCLLGHGLILFSLWQLGSLSGALIGRAVNPAM